MKTFIAATDVIEEAMTILKYKDKKVVYCIFKGTHKTIEFPSISFPIEPSRAKFLSIEYTHPDMDKSIVIELGDEYYMTNNHLLSPLFVKRYLEYNHSKGEYTFDENYKIRIMDNNIKICEVTSDYYINLNKNSYEILSLLDPKHKPRF